MGRSIGIMKILLLSIIAVSSLLLQGAQAGEMGWTLKQLRSHFGHEEGGSSDGSSVNYPSGTFFFDPDGTVGEINIWKDGHYNVQPFTEQEIYSSLNKASEITWTQTANTLKLEDGFLTGDLEFIGTQHNKPVFSASVSRDLRNIWILSIETIR